MKKMLITVVTMILVLCNCCAVAEEFPSFYYSGVLPMSETLEVVSDVADINIMLYGGEQPTFSVSGEVEPEITIEEGRLEVRANDMATPVSLEILLPSKEYDSLKAYTITGRIYLDNAFFREAFLGTSNGDILVEGAQVAVKAQTRGNVSVEVTPTDVVYTITSLYGDIEVIE